MKPTFTVCDCSDYSILLSVDFDTLNDLIQAALNKAYNEGYKDGQDDNIKSN